jgi:uncharacterized protein (TIGR02996 family)
MAKAQNVWTATHIKSLAPDESSIRAAREVLSKGGFGTVEPTFDNRGWWVVCRGLTDTYQVSVRLHQDLTFQCECTCPSPKYPCKHALALLLYLVDHTELRVEAEAPKAAASDFEGLLRAVFRNSKDDTPRLVFADFLEENGQADRAALIRYQCEQARYRSNSKRYKELAKLIEPVWNKLKSTIMMPYGFTCTPVRGFLRLEYPLDIIGDVGALPARFTNLFRDGWVETVVMEYSESFPGMDSLALPSQSGEIDVSRFPVGDDELLSLVGNTTQARASGRLAQIKVHKRNQKAFEQLLRAERGESVSLGTNLPPERYFRSSPAVFDFLLRTGRLSGARELSITGKLGDAEIASLLTANLSGLVSLTLEGWSLTRTGLQALANSPALAQLVRLELIICDLPDGNGALTVATGLPALHSLGLIGCDLADNDAKSLAKSQALPNLRTLDLRDNHRITASGAAAVLAAKHLPRLTDVNLANTRIAHPEQLPLILNAPDRGHLSIRFAQIAVNRWVDNEFTVSIGGRDNSGGLFDGLKGCAGARRITAFTASHLNLGAKEVAALAAALDPKKLQVLHLSENPLQNAGASAVATAFANYQLRELNLAECRIQAGGVEALVASPLWKHLQTLDLSRNNIAKAGVDAMVKADTPPQLKELILSYCWLGVNERKTPTSKTRDVTGASRLRSKFGEKVVKS